MLAQSLHNQKQTGRTCQGNYLGSESERKFVIMRFSTSLSRRALTAGASALASAAILTGGAFAQESTPAATPGGPPEGFPVAVHQGTCEEHNQTPAFELENAITFGTHGENEPQSVGASGVSATLYSSSGTIDSPLEELANEGHVIAVHESPENMGTVVACGPIAGFVDEGTLGIALTSVEDSSIVGVAILEGEDQINAEVYLFDTEVADPQATPAS